MRHYERCCSCTPAQQRRALLQLQSIPQACCQHASRAQKDRGIQMESQRPGPGQGLPLSIGRTGPQLLLGVPLVCPQAAPELQLSCALQPPWPLSSLLRWNPPASLLSRGQQHQPQLMVPGLLKSGCLVHPAPFRACWRLSGACDSLAAAARLGIPLSPQGARLRRASYLAFTVLPALQEQLSLPPACWRHLSASWALPGARTKTRTHQAAVQRTLPWQQYIW